MEEEKQVFDNLSDIAPKAVVAAVTLWAGASYFVIAPEVAARVVRADHMAACEASYRTLALKAAEKKLTDIPPPVPDAGREATARQLRAVLNNPLMGQLGKLNIPGVSSIDEMRRVLADYEDSKKAAVAAYRASIEKLKADTATHLGQSGSVCGCIADEAVSETRTDWALFSGTFGLLRPASLRQFGQRMEKVASSGVCSGKAGA